MQSSSHNGESGRPWSDLSRDGGVGPVNSRPEPALREPRTRPEAAWSGPGSLDGLGRAWDALSSQSLLIDACYVACSARLSEAQGQAQLHRR